MSQVDPNLLDPRSFPIEFPKAKDYSYSTTNMYFHVFPKKCIAYIIIYNYIYSPRAVTVFYFAFPGSKLESIWIGQKSPKKNKKRRATSTFFRTHSVVSPRNSRQIPSQVPWLEPPPETPKVPPGSRIPNKPGQKVITAKPGAVASITVGFFSTASSVIEQCMFKRCLGVYKVFRTFMANNSVVLHYQSHDYPWSTSQWKKEQFAMK